MTRPEGLEAIFAGDGAPYAPVDLLTSIVGAERIERFRFDHHGVVLELGFDDLLDDEPAWILTRADMRFTLYEEGLDAERWIEDFGRYDPWAIACRLPPRGARYELIGFDEAQR